MASEEVKKSGFRSLFSRRSSKDVGQPKKLSKRGPEYGGLPGSDAEKLGSHFEATPHRQDSGSFTSQTLDENEPPRLPSYDDVAAFSAHSRRDYPYAAAEPGFGSGVQLLADQTEYRRNSEGLEQHAAPLYRLSPIRSASVPQAQDEPHIRHIHSAPTGKSQPRKLSKSKKSPLRQDDILDKDTGERKDLTDMMHAFTFIEELDIIDEKHDELEPDYDPTKPDGTATLGSASPEVWLRVADFLSALDVANLASTCRTMYARIGRPAYKLLADPTNRPARLKFLLAVDHKMPRHLFCFPCAQWHLRIQPGREKLKPQNVLNPLFECPNQTNIHRPPPRIRISEGRTLPFAFVQLARRHQAFGPEFGMPHQTLARRWKDPFSDWSHESTYHITDKGHVIMRVKSQHYVEGGMTDAAKRLLIYSRGDYTPYFSVCSHWKDGLLTSIPKCALGHIPYTAPDDQLAYKQLKEKAAGKRAVGLVNLCSHCRPMRRCPECPTEYLFELKLLEDKAVSSFKPERFKQGLLVTRWTDLGPGISPTDPEWSAVVGENKQYDSFLEIGRRAVSGIFESAFTDTIPGQRILSTNPKHVKADEIGGDWY